MSHNDSVTKSAEWESFGERVADRRKTEEDFYLSCDQV